MALPTAPSPLQVVTGAAAAALLLLGGIALAADGDQSGTGVRAGAPGSTATTTAATKAATGLGAAQEPVDATSTSVAGGPPTTVAGLRAVPGTIVHADGPVVAEPPPAASTLPPPITAPSAAECTSADVVVSASPDRQAYARGQEVVVTATAENRSSRTCMPGDPSMEIRDSAGALVMGMTIVDMYTMPVPGQPPPVWEPGRTVSNDLRWSGGACHDGGCGPAPAGTYTVNVRFGPYTSSPASFTIA